MLSNKGGVQGGQMLVWIEHPWFHWIGVWMKHRLMHEHVGKCAKEAKKWRKPNG